MLIIVSGPDRVGKSTLIAELADVLGECRVVHHNSPPSNQENVFDYYKKDILKWMASKEKHCIFDRGWPCTHILEQFRRNNLGHMEEMIDLEIWVNEMVNDSVIHIGQFRPWHWSAPLHLEELNEESCHGDSAWYLRDQYISRMQEHEAYQTQLLDFYDRVTMFPNVQLMESVDAIQVIESCQKAISESGR